MAIRQGSLSWFSLLKATPLSLLISSEWLSLSLFWLSMRNFLYNASTHSAYPHITRSLISIYLNHFPLHKPRLPYRNFTVPRLLRDIHDAHADLQMAAVIKDTDDRRIYNLLPHMIKFADRRASYHNLNIECIDVTLSSRNNCCYLRPQFWQRTRTWRDIRQLDRQNYFLLWRRKTDEYAVHIVKRYTNHWSRMEHRVRFEFLSLLYSKLHCNFRFLQDSCESIRRCSGKDSTGKGEGGAMSLSRSIRYKVDDKTYTTDKVPSFRWYSMFKTTTCGVSSWQVLCTFTSQMYCRRYFGCASTDTILRVSASLSHHSLKSKMMGYLATGFGKHWVRAQSTILAEKGQILYRNPFVTYRKVRTEDALIGLKKLRLS